MTYTAIKAFWREEEGQDLVEYALLLAFLALASITVLTTVGGQITTLFNDIGSALTSADTAAQGGGA